jgi:secretion/DNA translocation related TadE-like protein
MSGQRCRQPFPDCDQGSASIWAVGGIAVLFLLAAVILAFGSVVQTRHRVTSAADLGSLAAAAHAPEGESAACARAQWVAGRMGARVTSCRLLGWDVLIEVSGPLPGELERFGAVRARSRAGPVDR